jgi:hypothetical protein
MLRKPQPELPLEERIEAFRAELDAFLDKKAIEIKATCESVPIQVIKNLLANRAPNCPCAQALDVLRSDI